MQPNERLPVGARRDQIVQEAAILFAARGYHGTSMQDIAARVGMLKGSLYAHVANKEEILLEIVSTTARRFMEAVEPIAQTQEAPLLRLRRALQAHIGVIAEHRAGATVYLFEWRHLEGQPLRWFGEAHGRYERLWHAMIDEGVARGVFPGSVQPPVATNLILAAAAGICHWPHERAAIGHAAIAENLADLVLGSGRALS